MTDEQAAQIMGALSAAYPRQELSKETITLYRVMLSDLPFDAVKAAVLNLIRTSRFFPTVAEITEEVAERTLGLPSPAEAWEEILAAAQGRYCPASGCKTPLVAEVAQKFTWADFETTERQGITRAHFLEMYQKARAEAIRRFQAPRRMIELPGGRPALEGRRGR